MTNTRWRQSLWHSERILWQPGRLDSNAPWRGIFRAVTRLVTLQEPVYVWRGHQDIRWPLVPSLHRKLGIPPNRTYGIAGFDEIVSNEVHQLLTRARAHGHDVVNGRKLPDLGVLALLQHNGAATPLLDVTTDPIVALYFAAQPSPLPRSQRHDEDGVVLAIDTRPDAARAYDIEAAESWSDAVQQLATAEQDIGVYTPPIVSERIMAQRGRFIFGPVAERVPYSTLATPIHSRWSSGSLQALFDPDGAGRPVIPRIVGIRVPADSKARVRGVLANTYGLTAESLFPDLSGFASAHDAAAPPLTG
jgi:hypothetical protein